MSQLVFSIKSSILDRQRDLVIGDNYIEFDDQDLVSAKPTRFHFADIEGLRYGIRWINGFQFVIGRIYSVDVREKSGRIIKIRLKSMYGIRKKQLGEKYSAIVNTLYDKVFNDISRSFLEQIEQGREVNILGIRISGDGVLLPDSNSRIAWPDLGTRSFARYFAVFSKSSPDLYATFEYLTEWNTGILADVCDSLVRRQQHS